MKNSKKHLHLALMILVITGITTALLIAVFKQPTSPSNPQFPGTYILNLPQSHLQTGQNITFHLSIFDDTDHLMCEDPTPSTSPPPPAKPKKSQFTLVQPAIPTIVPTNPTS